MLGIRMSLTITSGGSARAAASATAPSSACTTLAPSSSSSCAKNQRTAGSSSATITRRPRKDTSASLAESRASSSAVGSRSCSDTSAGPRRPAGSRKCTRPAERSDKCARTRAMAAHAAASTSLPSPSGTATSGPRSVESTRPRRISAAMRSATSFTVRSPSGAHVAASPRSATRCTVWRMVLISSGLRSESTAPASRRAMGSTGTPGWNSTTTGTKSVSASRRSRAKSPLGPRHTVASARMRSGALFHASCVASSVLLATRISKRSGGSAARMSVSDAVSVHSSALTMDCAGAA